MSKRERLIKKVCGLPPDADADDVVALLKECGWLFDRQRGSHMIFIKQDEMPLSIPLVSGRRVKRIYLKKICELLDLGD